MATGPLTDALRETLARFDGTGEPRTTTEIAARLDLGRRSTYERLDRLVEHGELRTKKVGANARVWWRPPDPPAGDGASVEIGDVEPVDASTVDVATLRARARRLERQRDQLRAELDAVFQRVDDACVALDEELRFTFVNDRAEALLERPAEALLGRRVHELFPAADEPTSGDCFREVLETRTPTTHEAYVEPLASWLEATVYPTESGLSVYFRDVSERKAREVELEMYETIVETVADGVYAADEAYRFALVNEAYAELVGRSRDELLGRHISTVVDDDVVAIGRRRRERLRAGEDTGSVEVELETAGGGTVAVESRYAKLPADGEFAGTVGVVRDVSERRRHERELERRVRQQAVVMELGLQALESHDLDALLADAAAAVARTLDNDFCKVLDLDADAGVLRLRQGVGWDAGVVGSATVSAVEDDSQAAYTLRSKHPVVVEDLETESRFGGPDLLTDHGVRSGISTVIGPADDPWGILGTHDRAPKASTEYDVTFVQSVATILATAIERHRYERALARQHERLVALDELNRVVRDLSTAVIDQSTREEIERVVCEGLAATDSYAFAWIGAVDGRSGAVRLRTEAGVEGYLDARAITVDGDRQSAGPIGRAIATREVQVVEDIFGDATHARWRDAAREWGYQSAAVIPIRHEDVVHGVLGVYADRPHAFSVGEHEVVGHLGEVVGHAIAAVERKRALTSREVVELEFELAGVFDAFDRPPIDGRLSLERSVPVGDGVYLAYGTATGDVADRLDALVEGFPHVTSARRLDAATADGGVRVEVRLVDPPVLSSATALGGYVDGASLEQGDSYLRVHLPPSADARELVDLVRAAYPGARLTCRRQFTREAESLVPVSRALVDALTPHQRTALETAYLAGYFESPRLRNGAEVAGALGVSAATFHQHLRKAQRTVLRLVLDAAAPG